MRESALSFGPANLIGVLTEPAAEVLRPDAPALLILNSGILHRPGASRLYVKIARAMAEKGFRTLRFDFSGIGDSEVRRDAIPIEERFVRETREAMDYLQESLDVDRFVLGGLCSGADGAFWAGLEDDRVVGIWQIDAFCYQTPRHYWHRFAPKILDPRAWAHSIRVRVEDALAKDARSEEEEIFVKPEYRRVFPPKDQVEQGLGSLLDRGVGLFFFFTGGLEEYNYSDQHSDAFSGLGLRDRAVIRYEPTCTHMVMELEHQQALVRDLQGWIESFAPRTGVLARP